VDYTLAILNAANNYRPGAVAVVDHLLFGSTAPLDPAQVERLRACEAERTSDPVGWEEAVERWLTDAFG
jgi:hypothetical protein